jgi:XTP/dITP diphosphohydrolase
MQAIVAATGNAGKLREIREILAPQGLSVLSGDDVGGIPDVHEDGATFEANAIKKAMAVAAFLDRPVMADDSGLEVTALDGAPGVRSARYAGDGASDADKIRKLLAAMDGVPDRRARFVCVVAVAVPGRLVGTAAGEVRGAIVGEPRGSGGFGYDPVFMPDGYALTFGELPASVKNRLSHRAAALRAALAAGLLEALR